MGFFSGLARLLLVVINIIFILLGLALSIVGFILRFGEAIYGPVLDKGKDLLAKVLTDTQFGTFVVDDIDLGQIVHSLAIGFIIGKNSSKSKYSSLNYGPVMDNGKDLLAKVLEDTKFGSFNVDAIDMGEIVHSLALGLIIGGLVLLAISAIGCCGACYKLDIMLWLYAIVIIVFVVVEAVAIGLLYGKPDLVKDNVKRSLADYKGLGSSEVVSVGWNIVMIQFQCCGVESYEDFADAPNWDTTPGPGVTLVTPIACCKSLPTSPTAVGCATAYDPTTNNGETGCYETLWKQSFANTTIAIPVLVVCGIIQFAFIFFAIYIAKSDKNGVSPI